MLENLLQLNPYYRMTAYECLQNRVFDKYRDLRREEAIKVVRESNNHKPRTDHSITNFASPKRSQRAALNTADGVVDQSSFGDLQIHLPID